MVKTIAFYIKRGQATFLKSPKSSLSPFFLSPFFYLMRPAAALSFSLSSYDSRLLKGVPLGNVPQFFKFRRF